MTGQGKGAHIDEGPATCKALGKTWVGDTISAPRELTVCGRGGGGGRQHGVRDAFAESGPEEGGTH